MIGRLVRRKILASFFLYLGNPLPQKIDVRRFLGRGGCQAQPANSKVDDWHVFALNERALASGFNGYCYDDDDYRFLDCHVLEGPVANN